MQQPATCGSGLSRRHFLNAVAACATTPLGLAASERTRAAPEDGYIDAHVHVWSSDTVRYPLKPGFPKSRLRRPSFTPDELWAHARPCGVTRVVLIQISHYGIDNSYMLDTIEGHPGVFSGVAPRKSTGNSNN